MRGENVPVIFGLKLRQLREERGYGLKELSELAGMSPSYVNEIEKGKKYPKADKILQLAAALGVEFDEMVSLRLSEELHPLESFLDSPIIQALPLQMFGLAPRDILDLISRAPKEVSALISTLVEIAEGYGMRVEHFFYAMLRSYQETHDNYFEEIEEAIEAYGAERPWASQWPVSEEDVREALTGEMGIAVDEESLAQYPELQGFRSVWVNGPPRRLLLNPRLSSRQKAFQMGREIGYQVLGLKERGLTSSRAEVESFEQVLNDFKASYFAGGLLIPQKPLVADLKGFFKAKKFSGDAFLKMMAQYDVTPEMFLYRLTQIIPKHFGMHRPHFLRIAHFAGSAEYHVTKKFNVPGMFMPAGLDWNEHLCRRWSPISVLRDMEHGPKSPKKPVVVAQRARFLNHGAEHFLITLARPLTLTENTHSSVTLGFDLDDTLRSTVGFWDHKDIEVAEINETCERCTLPDSACPMRVAPPEVAGREERLARRKSALKSLFHDVRVGKFPPRGN